MSNKHDIGHGVMMPPMSMHTPRQWKEMLVEAQKDRIKELESDNSDLEYELNTANEYILDLEEEKEMYER